MVSGREPEIWATEDQVSGSHQHPSFHRAMDKFFMIILFHAYSFTEAITKYNIMYPVLFNRESRNLKVRKVRQSEKLDHHTLCQV